MKRSGFSSIRTLRASEPIPEGTPKRYANDRGYIRLRWKVAPNQYVEEYEHRIVMGRPDSSLHVHHINGVKDDNRPENLEILTREEHGRKHADGWWPEDAQGIRGDHWPHRSASAKAKVERRIAREQERAAEVKRMRELYESGKSLPQVAEIVGIHHANVYQRLKRAGVKFRTSSDYANPIDVAELVEKYQAGRSQQSLAAEYRVTAKRIKDTLVKAGCPIRKPGRPKNHSRKAENSARLLVRQRSGGICEVCGAEKATNFQHRKNRSQGGEWSASNGLDVCGMGNLSGCHGFIHQNPAAAAAHGWTVRSDMDPAEVPVTVTLRPETPFSPAVVARFVLDNDGARTEYEEVHDVSESHCG